VRLRTDAFINVLNAGMEPDPAQFGSYLFGDSVFLAIGIFLFSPIYCKYMLYKWRGASKATKKQVVEIAKKLNLKNPNKIKVKVGNYSSFRNNAMVDSGGTLYLGQNIAENASSNKGKFVIGHELSHTKNRDFFKMLLFMVGANLFWFVSLSKVVPGAVVPKVSKLCFTLNMAGLVFFRKVFSEAMADIGSASLGREFAQGGIDFFKKGNDDLSELACFSRWKYKIRQFFGDPHFSPWFRMKYLTWFRDWKYGH